MENTIQKVKENNLIHIFTNAEVKEVEGFIGNFRTKLVSKGQEYILEHGVIIVATGGEEYKPTEYLYGRHERVLTQLDLEQKLAAQALNAKNLNNVVMIQCVGSRNEERPYCSKVCCSQAIKNSLKIKEQNPEANIYILYKDIITYGFKEEFYTEARSQGITFLRYNDENKPEVISKEGKLKVKVLDLVLGEELLIEPDLLVLSTAIIPSPGNEELARMLKVPLTEEGFFLEAHVKLRPVDFAIDGIFLCGLAHSPKSIDETISQAIAAAGRAAIPLAKGKASAEPTISWVDEEKCIGCGLCESICAFKAIQLVSKNGTKKAEIVPATCKGCGLCSASCPQRAITHLHFSREDVMSEIRALVPA